MIFLSYYGLADQPYIVSSGIHYVIENDLFFNAVNLVEHQMISANDEHPETLSAQYPAFWYLAR